MEAVAGVRANYKHCIGEPDPRRLIPEEGPAWGGVAHCWDDEYVGGSVEAKR